MGHIRGKQDMVRPEEIIATHEPGGITVNSRIAIKHPVIVHQRSPESSQILCLEEHFGIIITSNNPFAEKGDHGPAVVDNEFQIRIAVKNTTESQSRHGHTGFIGPAQDLPDPIAGVVFIRVIGRLPPAHGVYEDGEIELIHYFIEGKELFMVQRLA